MFDPVTISIVAAVFLLAGTVKGVIGLGLPTVSLALLTAALGLQPAMALMLVPSLVTNLWQAAVGGYGRAILARLWPFLLAATATIWVGAAWAARVEVAALSMLLGASLAVYAALGLTRARLTLPAGAERWSGPLAGCVNGVLTGMTGSFVVPGVPYLQALGLPRDMLVQAMGMLFTLSTLGLGLALAGRGLLGAELGQQSAAAVVPALLGMVLGQRLRGRIPEAAFRKVLFAALSVLGLYIVFRAA
ncbi:MAG TPA: sulfite exporter TauE/SafE family protein [Thermohalobaculum sp.]|nr:sulfite exporter TauE/SafE family protein [Thermohalobaculum sp.]